MAITLQVTSLGLLIDTGVSGEQLVSLTDYNQLFSLFDANPHLQSELKEKLLNQFKTYTTQIAEDFKDDSDAASRFLDMRGIHSWMTSMQQYSLLVAPQYSQYKAAIEAARNQS